MILGEWQFGAALLSEEDIRGGSGVLGTNYTKSVDTRFTDTVLGPLLTTVDCSGADAAGGGSVGTPATTRSMTTTGGINAPEKIILARGTKLAAIRLDTLAQILDGTQEGAGAPYGEAVTQVLYTKAADADEQVSIFFDNTIYRVLEDIPETGGFTAGANNESFKLRHVFEGQSDSAATQYLGLGRADGTPNNSVQSLVLSGSTDFDASAWQDIGTISGEDVIPTGGAMLGRFPLIGTDSGVYLLDSDAKKFRNTTPGVAKDPDANQGFGAQMYSMFGGMVLVPMLRSLRAYLIGGQSFSVGPETYTYNTSPIQGRVGWGTESDRWCYIPVYDVEGDDTYICAFRPREDGDPPYMIPFFPIAFMDGKESKICYGTGLKGSQARYTLWTGSDSNAAYWFEGTAKEFYNDSGYTYSASGTLYGTRLRREPDKEKTVTHVELDTLGCSSTETLSVEIVYTDFKGVERTVLCGTPIVSNGHHKLMVPGGGIKCREFYPQLSFARSTSTASPRLKNSRLAVYGG